MDIQLQTNHEFLQDHFYPVRNQLRGEVTVFDGSRQYDRQQESAASSTVTSPTESVKVETTQAASLAKVPARPTPEAIHELRAKHEISPLSVLLSAGRFLGKFRQTKARPHTTSGARWATNMILSAITLFSIATASVLLVPSLYYLVFPADVIEIKAPDAGTAFGGAYADGANGGVGSQATASAQMPPEEAKYVPAQDATLPQGDWLVIPRIGVRSVLQPTIKPDEALATGLWWVPDFGQPGDVDLPMIVAAHRYGWQWWWKTDYWKYHSFYLLPDTEPGDRIEVISDQRKWVYEIYAGEEGEQITDYDADLILYTCKYLQSPIRHFRYARLIDPTRDTQK